VIASGNLRCSFCGKSNHEVRNIVTANRRSGPNGRVPVICDECIVLCAEVVRGDDRPEPPEVA
jgi:hypothetical protein